MDGDNLSKDVSRLQVVRNKRVALAWAYMAALMEGLRLGGDLDGIEHDHEQFCESGKLLIEAMRK